MKLVIKKIGSKKIVLELAEQMQYICSVVYRKIGSMKIGNRRKQNQRNFFAKPTFIRTLKQL